MDRVPLALAEQIFVIVISCGRLLECENVRKAAGHSAFLSFTKLLTLANICYSKQLISHSCVTQVHDLHLVASGHDSESRNGCDLATQMVPC